MATTIERTEIEPEDLLRITDRPMPELVHGMIHEREPMGEQSDAIAAQLLAMIWNFVREKMLGRVHGSQGSYQIFPDDPRKVRIPDVSFTHKDRLSPSGPAEGHSRVVPDLVVEVVSPNDRAADLEEKILDFLAAGVPLIWTIYPKTRTVLVIRDDHSIRRLRDGDTLDGEDILPGFRCEVAALFEV